MEYKNWVLWHANGYMLSNTNTQELGQFKTFDEVINYLYLSGEKCAARFFNNNPL